MASWLGAGRPAPLDRRPAGPLGRRAGARDHQKLAGGNDDSGFALAITDLELNQQRLFPLLESSQADEDLDEAEARALYRERRQRGRTADRYLVRGRFVSLRSLPSFVRPDQERAVAPVVLYDGVPVIASGSVVRDPGPGPIRHRGWPFPQDAVDAATPDEEGYVDVCANQPLQELAGWLIDAIGGRRTRSYQTGAAAP